MLEDSVTTILLFLHFSGLMLGAASGFGAMVVARQARSEPSPQLAALRPKFLRLGLAGILLLWLSGLLLWFFRYDFVDLGPAFHTKLTLAGLLLIAIVGLNAIMRRGTPPPWTRALGMATPFLTLAAMALAVYVFQ
jgi:hypothetical protein